MVTRLGVMSTLAVSRRAVSTLPDARVVFRADADERDAPGSSRPGGFVCALCGVWAPAREFGMGWLLAAVSVGVHGSVLPSRLPDEMACDGCVSGYIRRLPGPVSATLVWDAVEWAFAEGGVARDALVELGWQAPESLPRQ